MINASAILKGIIIQDYMHKFFIILPVFEIEFRNNHKILERWHYNVKKISSYKPEM